MHIPSKIHKYMENPPLWYCWHHMTVEKIIHVIPTWHPRVIYTVTLGTFDVTKFFRLDSAKWRPKVTVCFLGHRWTILLKCSRDFHVFRNNYWQQSFLFESFCDPVSPFSPMILINTFASVPAHSISPVVTSISNFVILNITARSVRSKVDGPRRQM